jgi:hypothetical protein
MLKDHGSRNRAICVAHQVFKQQEFLRPQIDDLSQPRGSPPDQIQFEIAGAQHTRRIGAGKIGGRLTQPYRQAKPHRQLRCEEWFTHAIIRTGFE